MGNGVPDHMEKEFCHQASRGTRLRPFLHGDEGAQPAIGALCLHPRPHRGSRLTPPSLIGSVFWTGPMKPETGSRPGLKPQTGMKPEEGFPV